MTNKTDEADDDNDDHGDGDDDDDDKDDDSKDRPVFFFFFKKKPPKRTVVAAIDLSKAFDMVNQDILLEKVSVTTLHPDLKRWLLSYFSRPLSTMPITGCPKLFGMSIGVAI